MTKLTNVEVTDPKTGKRVTVSVKNVKTFAGHDGQCGLNCDVMFGPRKVTHVYDSAHGGGFEYDNYRMLDSRGDWKALEEVAASNTWISEFDDDKLPRAMDVDMFVDCLVQVALQAQEFKRWGRNYIFFQTADNVEDGEFSRLKRRAKVSDKVASKKDEEAMLAHILKHWVHDDGGIVFIGGFRHRNDITSREAVLDELN